MSVGVCPACWRNGYTLIEGVVGGVCGQCNTVLVSYTHGLGLTVERAEMVLNHYSICGSDYCPTCVGIREMVRS